MLQSDKMKKCYNHHENNITIKYRKTEEKLCVGVIKALFIKDYSFLLQEQPIFKPSTFLPKAKFFLNRFKITQQEGKMIAFTIS